METNWENAKVPGQSILVVDDEEQVCELLAEALTYMGHEVVTARDGQDALEKLEHADFHIVITDLDMPRMDGMELIRYLVQNRNGTDMIAITGHTMRYRYTDVVAAGAADFISKPFSLDELEAKVKRVIRERELRTELERLAIHDPLTGLYNRHFFARIVRREAVRSIRYEHALFLFYLDVDRFKEYNDKHGHQAGDQLLIQLSKALKASVRQDVDTAFRFGGDEFTVLLPHLDRDQAGMVAERIRHNYNSLGLEPTHLSIGMARFRARSGDVDQDVEDMIQRADAALYRAKHDRGGNTACFDEDSLL